MLARYSAWQGIPKAHSETRRIRIKAWRNLQPITLFLSVAPSLSDGDSFCVIFLMTQFLFVCCAASSFFHTALTKSIQESERRFRTLKVYWMISKHLFQHLIEETELIIQRICRTVPHAKIWPRDVSLSNSLTKIGLSISFAGVLSMEMRILGDREFG